MVFEPNDCSRLASRRIEKPFPASLDEAQDKKELHFSLRVPLFFRKLADSNTRFTSNLCYNTQSNAI